MLALLARIINRLIVTIVPSTCIVDRLLMNRDTISLVHLEVGGLHGLIMVIMGVQDVVLVVEISTPSILIIITKMVMKDIMFSKILPI